MPHIRIKLRDALEAHGNRTGKRWTYADVAQQTGLSKATVESIATRPAYNATLHCVARLCVALNCTPGDLLELVDADAAQPETTV